MECKYETKKQLDRTDCVKAVKPNASLKTLSIFGQSFTGIPQGFQVPVSSEEIKAGRAQQLELEYMRSMAIIYARRLSVI